MSMIASTSIATTAARGAVMFPQEIFSLLVYGALGGTALGLAALIFLILRDRKKGEIW